MGTSLSLLDQLKETWPIQDVPPFGSVVVIPNKAFKPEWKEQLQNEGVKIYAQALHNEAYLFLKANSVKPEESDISVSPLRLEKRRWSSQDESTLKELHSQGLSLREIAEKLGRSKISVDHKLQTMNSTPQTHAEIIEEHKEDTPQDHEDCIVKELLSACSLLYPSHRQACALLLREASTQVLHEKGV